MSHTIERLISLLVSRFGIPADEVTDDAELTALDLDSLALVELGMVVEKEFAITISETDVAPSDTVATIAKLIDDKVAVRGAGVPG